MQTLVQFAFLFAFMLFSMLSGMMLEANPIVGLAAFAIGAMCALVAIVLVLQENAARF